MVWGHLSPVTCTGSEYILKQYEHKNNQTKWLPFFFCFPTERRKYYFKGLSEISLNRVNYPYIEESWTRTNLQHILCTFFFQIYIYVCAFFKCNYTAIGYLKTVSTTIAYFDRAYHVDHYCALKVFQVGCTMFKFSPCLIKINNSIINIS